MDKRNLTERDICAKFVLPTVKRAGWDDMLQIPEEVYFTKGRFIVRGKLVSRGRAKKADFVLYYKPNIPIVIIEAKDNNHSVGDGTQPSLIAHLQVQQVTVAVKPREIVSQISYAGDEGGIVCHIVPKVRSRRTDCFADPCASTSFPAVCSGCVRLRVAHSRAFAA